LPEAGIGDVIHIGQGVEFGRESALRRRIQALFGGCRYRRPHIADEVRVVRVPVPVEDQIFLVDPLKGVASEIVAASLR
jgi:hypothetical protein